MNFSEGFSWAGLMRSCICFGTLVSMLAAPIAGLIFLIRGIHQRNPKLAILAVTAPLIYMFAMGWWIYGEIEKEVRVLTAENASPKDVPFLNLPPTATDIGYRVLAGRE